MTMPEPSFIFFRFFPQSADSRKALASSMQSLDSALLLIALGRYPHALITCDAAIESAIKASPAGSTLRQRAHFNELIEATKRVSKELAALGDKALTDFRLARNRMTHEGFSPRDDSESVGLLLETGLPFLHQCYLDLFSFDLWNALDVDIERQLRISKEVYLRGKHIAGLDRSYCLKSVLHLIRWKLKGNFSADWEIEELAESERVGSNFELKHKQRQHFERLFRPEWIFTCPMCNEPDAVVCQLDENELIPGNIVPRQMACTNCSLVVQKAELYLTETLLRDEVALQREAILKDYGI